MNNTDNGAITEGGVWGGVAAAMGGAVRAIQSPSVTKRQFWTTVVTATFFGVVTGFIVMWLYSDRVPPHLAACAGAGVGLFVSELMKLLMKVMQRASDRLIDGVDARLDAAGWKANSQTKTDIKSDVKPSPSAVLQVPPPPAGGANGSDPTGPTDRPVRQ
jgi:hypothetical protein